MTNSDADDSIWSTANKKEYKVGNTIEFLANEIDKAHNVKPS